MTAAVAQEMLELADRLKSRPAMPLGRKLVVAGFIMTEGDRELIIIALRESALSRNEVVGERKI